MVMKYMDVPSIFLWCQFNENLLPDKDRLANDHLGLVHPVIDQAAPCDMVDRTVQKEINEKCKFLGIRNALALVIDM